MSELTQQLSRIQDRVKDLEETAERRIQQLTELLSTAESRATEIRNLKADLKAADDGIAALQAVIRRITQAVENPPVTEMPWQVSAYHAVREILEMEGYLDTSSRAGACRCENTNCLHGDQECPRQAVGGLRMREVGQVCGPCAVVMTRDAPEYVLLDGDIQR